MSSARIAAAVAGLAASLAAASVAIPLISEYEGLVTVAAPDPIGIPTECWGHTGPEVVVGRQRTEAQCVDILAADAVRHGVAISRCIKTEIPVDTRAAFTSFAFNVGVSRFCGSTMARKVNAGDIAGACAELSKWTYAGGRELKGLVRRRAAERTLCEKGLAR